ncbi:MAG: hypothetical protein ACLP9D_10920 [Candidatus Bathyarchaeia archaeon]
MRNCVGLRVFLFPGAATLYENHLENFASAAFRPIPRTVVLKLRGYEVVEMGFGVCGHADVYANLVGAAFM